MRYAMKSIGVSLMLLLTGTAPSGVSAQSGTTFSGEATVLSGSVAGVSVDAAGTGPLEPGGGARNNSLVCYPDAPECTVGLPDQTDNALSVQLLNSSTVGRGNHSRSNASVAELSLVINGVRIEAGLVQSAAEAACQAGAAVISGVSEIADLTVAGAAEEVTGEPNQTISVGGVTIIINEQTGPGGAPVQSGNTGDITVNALHILVDPVTVPVTGVEVPGTDLIVSQAHADIRCGQPSCTFATKVTSGGTVALDGGKGSFAAAGRNGSDWGHFLFQNHVTREKMKATVQRMTFATDGVAEIVGMAQVNGEDGYSFTARLKDNGEPGRGADMFALTSSHPNFNVSDQPITGGNIQFHRPCKGS